MRQLTCTGPGAIEWRDVAEPRLQGDVEALVRPLAVARCDIDLFLTEDAAANLIALERLLVAVAQGDRLPAANAAGFVDFQLTRGELGVST